ncbi:MarR family winged helix-turn-helix transcriptional regulator [Caenispirillum bisanense]|uniref:Transcriptional regulator, MarR family n=1 Tax=Caenispirillum bisanense TaxID=414052 RepID=A0A286G551_9PROT|nr:MarR family transcriptional regulator [Caenispirillum bisanense]SOD90625.1 transcriptional regulator, MarR family [Caenispirillum bisanense]
MADVPLPIDRQLCFAVYSAAHALNRVYKPLLDPLGLTYPQYLVLLALWEEDGITVKQLGVQMHLDSGTLTPLLKRMEAAGLVTRRRDAADERQVRIGLTEEGRALRQRAGTVQESILCASKRTPAELEALRDQLTALRDALLADGCA